MNTGIDRRFAATRWPDDAEEVHRTQSLYRIGDLFVPAKEETFLFPKMVPCLDRDSQVWELSLGNFWVEFFKSCIYVCFTDLDQKCGPVVKQALNRLAYPREYSILRR